MALLQWLGFFFFKLIFSGKKKTNQFLTIIISKCLASGICVQFLASLITSCMTIEKITISTSQSGCNTLMAIRHVECFPEFPSRVSNGCGYPMLLLKWVRWAGRCNCISCVLYLMKPAYHCVRHKVLLHLGTPERSGLLQTSRLKKGMGGLVFSLELSHVTCILGIS